MTPWLVLLVGPLVAIRFAFGACPTPTFQPGTNHPVGTHPEAVAVGDLNADGKLDLVIANGNPAAQISVLLGNGTGGFGAALPFGVGAAPNDVRIADFDQDGKLDVLVANQGADTVTAAFGDGTGGFAWSSAQPSVAQPVSLGIADFTGDGKLDFAVVGLFNVVGIHYGTTGGGFVRQQPDLSAPLVPNEIAVGDFTGDGNPDLAVTNLGPQTTTGTVTFFHWFGSHFISGGRVPVGTPTTLITRDVNADTKLDLVVGENAGTVAVLLGDGKGGFSPPARFAAGALPVSIEAADLNRDGLLDLAVVNRSANTLSLLLGTGTGGFAAPTTLPTGSSPESVAAADFNGDGGPDLVVTNVGGDDATIYLNACPAPLDLVTTAVEVTQAIQDLQNSVVLVADKRTFVRVHVTAGALVDNVSARLEGLTSSGASLGPALRPLNLNGVIALSLAPSRSSLDDSFYFELPASWVHAGPVTLRAEVNPTRTISETNYANNVRSVAVTFQATKALPVRIVEYQYKDSRGVVQTTPPRQFDILESELRRKLPIGSLLPSRTTFFDEQADPGGNIFDALPRVKWWRQTYEPSSSGVLYYGLYMSLGGVAESAPGWTAVGNPAVGAHELGHLLSRKHAPCGNPDGIDTAYPYPNATIGGPAGDPARFYGFDPGDPALTVRTSVIPATASDEMSYCHPRWFSDYSYVGIRSYMQGSPVIQGAAPAPERFFASAGTPLLAAAVAPLYVTGDFLSVYGTLDRATGTVAPLLLSRQSQVSEIPPRVPGPYRIRLLGATGALLAEFPFTPEPSTEDGNKLLIAQVVSFVPGTRRIAIYSDGAAAEVASAAVSNSAPTVVVTAPAGGATIAPGAKVTVSWVGADGDGDALTYSLLYSRDSRSSWHALATGLKGNTLTVDAAQLEGTSGASTGFFRVVARDAVLTGLGDAGPFIVGNKPPQPRIASPADGTPVQVGALLALEGSAVDVEDGALPPSALSWSSDLSGALGTGSLLHVTLPQGVHLLTLTATDSDGLTARATARVYVDATPTTPLEITCPADVMTLATSSGGAAVSYTVPVVSAASVTCTPPPGSLFPPGATPVACTATDGSGNRATCSFQVRVDGPPTIRVPGDLDVDATAPTGAAVTYFVTVVDDFDPAPQLSCTPPAGAIFPIGSTNVACRAVDASGNTADAAFRVTVHGAVDQLIALLSRLIAMRLPPIAVQNLAPILEMAKTKLEGKDLTSACGFLLGAKREVAAQAGKATLTAEQAAVIGATLDRIAAVIGCQQR